MSKPLVTAVIEDEAVIAETLRMMLEDLGYTVPEPAMNPKEGFLMVKEEQPDIILMDINLNADIDGIELARQIKLEMEVPIVFITSYADPVTLERAKAVGPAGYLVKPFTAQDIFAAIEIAMVQTQKPALSKNEPENKKLFLKSGTTYIKINPPEIDFIHSEGGYLLIYSGSRKFVIRDSFDNVLERLPQSLFFRNHKSYCVNIERIDLIETEFIKIGEHEIPLGRTRKDELFKLLGLG